MKTIQLIIATLLLSLNLSAQNCEAWFYPNHDTGNYLTINFSDGSVPSDGIQSWQWDFGDGNTSTLQNPSHTYASEGEYTVSLSIQSNGCSNTYQQNVLITSTQGNCESDFYYEVAGQFLRMVNFTDNSNFSGNNKQWFWDFGDTNTSTEQNPTHSFSVDTTYRVMLKITSDECTDSAIYMVTVGNNYQGDECLASFSHEVLDPAANSIQFYNTSYIPNGAGDSFAWSFGDGTGSNVENPVHSYASSGEYTVTLTITSGDCTNSFTNIIYTGNATWYPENCQALYWFTTASENHKNFNFYDYSYGNSAILSWYWDFGDGSYSYQPNPSHEFAEDGTYETSLTIFTEDCQSSFSIDIDVAEGNNSGDSLMPLFYPEIRQNEVIFHNLTRGNADSWQWNFGDGTSSTIESPSHNFDEPGIHEVSLSAFDGDEVNTIVIQFNTATLKNTNNTTFENVHFYRGAYTSVPEFKTFNFSISPNPADNFIKIKTKEKNIKVSIFDITGKCVLKQNSDIINIKNLKQGIYIMKISNNKLSGTVKFTKF